jgi:hypothetical protein
LVLFLPVLAVAATLLGAGLYLQQRADGSVVRRTAAEMPMLDVGVRQAVHATFAGDRQPVVGRPADLRLVLTSGADGAQIQARVAVPEGAALSKGMSRWEGSLDYQQVVEIPVSIVLPGDRGAFIGAEITTRLPDGRLLNSATSVYVDPGAPDSRPPEARTLIQENGEPLDVVIYKAE